MTYRKTVLCISTATNIPHLAADRAAGRRRSVEAAGAAVRLPAGARDCQVARVAHNGRCIMRATPSPVAPWLRPISAALLAAALLTGCITRSVDVRSEQADPAEFADWTCDRIDDELDAVQQRAADVAYAVDERAGNNIMAMGVGVTVFWPALLAMRPAGLEAADLARLKGRYEALRTASAIKGCPPPSPELRADVAATLPVAVGDRLFYEDRAAPRLPASTWVLRVKALRRTEIEMELESAPGSTWRQDRVGNVLEAPAGSLQWQRLIRGELVLGHVISGEMGVVGDPLARARLRGQVVAVGPQTVADRRFDVAVIELFGDAQTAEAFTRVDGALVVDRASGVLLRLDLRSAQPPFALQRRLVRVEAAPG
jgi:hypothetical protein